MEILDEVTAQIGQGGMRGVSRARDLKPKRTVARRQLPVPVRAMVRITAILLLTGLVASAKAVAQQSAFAPGSGPTVLIDLGHNSLFGVEPNLSPLTRLQDDGYITRTSTGLFTEEALTGIDIVVVAGALADRNAIRRPADCAPPPDMTPACFEAINAQIAAVWRHPIPSAFSVEELDTLQAWVERGGGLFLVFDMFPFPGAIEEFVSRFGVEVSNGFAVDERLLPPLPQETGPLLGQAAELVFRRVDQTLAAHPVTNGRSSVESGRRCGLVHRVSLSPSTRRRITADLRPVLRLPAARSGVGVLRSDAAPAHRWVVTGRSPSRGRGTPRNLWRVRNSGAWAKI